MPLTHDTLAQLVYRLGLVAVTVALVLMTSALASSLSEAWAQAGPFGNIRPPAASGFTGWLLAKQALFYRSMAGLIRAAKTNGSAYWGLMGISFAYGVFHAAGPGHGKAVISSYLLANEETWRRGIVLSFASAMLQALTAVVIVAIAAVLIGATAKMMGDTVRVIELVSYALIVLVGARLLWVKGRGFLHAVHEVGLGPETAPVAVALETPDHALHRRQSPAPLPPRTLSQPMRNHITRTITRMRTRMRITKRRAYCPGAMRMDRSRRNWRGQGVGGAGSRRSSPSDCGRARERSSSSYSRWRRACSGQASPRPS